jgi:hypothetical protein
MNPRITWELASNPLGSPEHTLGTTVLHQPVRRHVRCDLQFLAVPYRPLLDIICIGIRVLSLRIKENYYAL